MFFVYLLKNIPKTSKKQLIYIVMYLKNLDRFKIPLEPIRNLGNGLFPQSYVGDIKLNRISSCYLNSTAKAWPALYL